MLFSFVKATFSQTEEQRKFSVESQVEFEKFIINSTGTESLSAHFHTKSSYLDIYIDTPDFLLLKNNLSLRFRKRIFENDLPVSYTFQLKSEMTLQNSVRMEVEEPELSFYLVQSGNEWIPLTSILDTIFVHFENNPTLPLSPNVGNALLLLNSWIRLKSEGSIAPFQELLFMGFDKDSLKRLIPVTCGQSARYRSHVYANSDQDEILQLEKNKVKLSELPVFFKENVESNWLLESSFDRSVFYSLLPSVNAVANITEYEIENKYYLTEKGTNIMSIYGEELLSMFNMTSKYESKYAQAIKIFGGK
jgi:hypothetical protein